MHAQFTDPPFEKSALKSATRLNTSCGSAPPLLLPSTSSMLTLRMEQ